MSLAKNPDRMDVVNWWHGGIENTAHLLRCLIRLSLAAVLGGILGWEREREGKNAGVRTHMLVALGTALFVLVPDEAGLGADGIGRAVQGVAAGIGFIGAGTILKKSSPAEVRGLTTAGSIWLTAAGGVAVGMGWMWPALLAVLIGWLVLYLHPRSGK